jgi:hypothetical protein
MPRIDFDVKNKVAQTNYDYPKLKLKNGERARVLVGLESPVREYVHTLRKPQVINGVPQMIKATRKDGSTYDDYKMDFLSRPLCLGDASVLAKEGSDVRNCPMCALAKQHPDMTSAPQRRYAMHVIRYKTKAGTFDLITPYSIEVLVWSFTDRIFNQIADAANEWGDLRKHDLLLGPCTNETFQQFEMSVGAKAAWLEDASRKALTAQAFAENQIEDLAIACGSKKEKRWVDEDLNKIREAWASVSGAEVPVEGGTSSSLDEDLNSLLATGGATAAATAPVEETVVRQEPDLSNAADLDALFSAPTETAATTEAPASEAAATEDAPAATSFDDLFAGLND